MRKFEQASRNEFELDGVVPWGRRLCEYEAFLGLERLGDMSPILDAGGGPSSFAAEAAARGSLVVAADPLYRFSGAEIRGRFEEVALAMRAGMRRAAYRFKWSYYRSEDAVHALRREALNLFLADFEAGKREGRYIPASLPFLPFPDKAFRLAVSSHLLFLYGDDLDFAFHLAGMKELLRVAAEVRVFPLINLDGRPSSHLPGIIEALSADGARPELVTVPFEFQAGATRMLKVSRG
ncbi:conserved hypothetical protein [Parvibaculum lavamentivorans DS-1]|uniref:SAM-dependent methyltransferase n=2 Tax=Parvibaculum lavamentivorans TaxID=256618 RepID=A7HX32_PARL1|nr:conserved hypothetical protein [Parvibaculum lavamentivorans DS-1]